MSCALRSSCHPDYKNAGHEDVDELQNVLLVICRTINLGLVFSPSGHWLLPTLLGQESSPALLLPKEKSQYK